MYFLEDTDIIEESNEIVLEDVTGLMSSTLDAEISWNNLSMKMIQTEYSAIKNEDMGSLEEGKTKWWKSVVEWFKQRIMDLKKITNDVIDRVGKFFDFAGRFYDTNKEDMSKITEDIELQNIYKWKSDALGILDRVLGSSVDSKITQISKASREKAKSGDEICKEVYKVESLAKLTTEIAKTLRNETKEKTLKISVSDAKKAFESLKDAKNGKGKIKRSFDGSIKFLEGSQKLAEGGLKLSDISDQQRGYKNEITTLKNGSVVINRAKSTAISLYNQYISDCMRISRAALGGTSKKAKAKPETNSNESFSLFGM